MANTRIALKKSPTPGSIPSAGNLANGELAINYADGIIYYKNVSGQIAQISSGEFFGTVNANGTFLTATLPGDIVSILAGQNITISTDAIHNKLTIGADLSPANGRANVVGTAGNNYTNYVGASANAYALALKPDLSPVFVTANAAFDAANSSNGWANTVGAAANSYAYSTFASQAALSTGLTSTNSWSTTIGLSGNSYTNYVATSINNYSTATFATLGSVASNWAVTNAAYSQANTAVNNDASNWAVTNASYTVANTARDSLASNWAVTNASYTVANSSNGWANTVGTAGNNYTNYVGTSANAYTVTLSTAGNNYAIVVGAASNTWTNTVGTAANNYAAATYATLGSEASNWTVTNAAYTSANAGVVALGSANSLWVVTNASYTVANTTIDSLASNWAVTNAAYLQANTGVTVGGSGFAATNSAFTILNAAYTQANTGVTVGSAAYAATNSAFTVLNTAYTTANNALPKAGGIISGDLAITGNLTISGNQSYVNTQTLLIGDNILVLNADIPGNVLPTENAGIEVNRGNKNANASLLWVETATAWALTSNTSAPISTYIASNADIASAQASINSNWSVTNTAYTQANTGVTVGTAAYAATNSAFTVLNAAYTTTNTATNSLASNWAVTNAAYVAANTALNNDASNWVVTNAAYTSANAGVVALGSANSLWVVANASYTVANNARDSLASNWSVTNTAYGAANGGFTLANTSNGSLVSNWVVTNAAYTSANAGVVALGSANSNWVVTNASYTVANNARDSLASNWVVTNAAYTTANSKTFTFNQNTAPATANTDDLWVNSDTGIVYENFGNTTNPIWAEFGPTGVNSGTSPGSGSFTELSVSGNVTVGKQVLVTYTPASTVNAAIHIAAANTKGGTGYADVLKFTNLSGGSTNPDKWIRLSSNGVLQIINNAYNSSLLTLSDSGDFAVSGNVTMNGIQPGYSANRPGFRVWGNGTTNNLTTTQNGNGVLNSNNWSVDFNQGSYLNGTTGVFTAPVAGLYQVNLVGRNSGYSSGISQLAITKNSAASVVCMLEFAASSSMNHAGVSSVVKLAVGDTLDMRVLAGQINFDGNDNWSVAYIG